MCKSQRVYLSIEIILFILLGFIIVNELSKKEININDPKVKDSLLIISDNNPIYYKEDFDLNKIDDNTIFNMILNTYDDELLNDYRFNEETINKKVNECLDINKKINIDNLNSNEFYDIKRDKNIIIVTKINDFENQLKIKNITAKIVDNKLIIERQVGDKKYNIIFIKDDKNYKLSKIKKLKD